MIHKTRKVNRWQRMIIKKAKLCQLLLLSLVMTIKIKIKTKKLRLQLLQRIIRRQRPLWRKREKNWILTQQIRLEMPVTQLEIELILQSMSIKKRSLNQATQQNQAMIIKNQWLKSILLNFKKRQRRTMSKTLTKSRKSKNLKIWKRRPNKLNKHRISRLKLLKNISDKSKERSKR